MIPLILLFVYPVLADYKCLCNYKSERHVYDEANTTSTQIGSMYEFDCFPTVEGAGNSDGFKEIHFKQQLGYVEMGEQIETQTCQGLPPSNNTANTTYLPTTNLPIVTSTAGAPASTPKPIILTQVTSTSAPSTTTPQPTTRTTTTTTTTTAAPTTQKPIPEGHVELCPLHIKTDALINHGFVGQFGDYCYELVDSPTQWDNAHRHCTLTSSGNLLFIKSEQEQNFIVRFLAQHHYVKSVWTGLNDKDREGTWKWNSGAPVTYTNLHGDFAMHSYADHSHSDCVVIKQGGEWTDARCGLSLLLGIGLGESHSYICQYSVTSKPASLFHVVGEALLPGLIG